MNINAFYEKDAARRLAHTLCFLARHDVSRWALTGGTAIELHLSRMRTPTLLRPLHDLDFIAESFDCLAVSLADLVISRHVHPHDPPAKTMLQTVYPETSVRIDVFRAYGSKMKRAQKIDSWNPNFKIVAFEDLVARHARLCCDLLRGQELAPKYARDFIRMLDFAGSQRIEPRHMENVWQEHCKPTDPKGFPEAAALLREAIAEGTDLLTPPVYSTDVDAVCPRCESTTAFRLADVKQVFALVGYC